MQSGQVCMSTERILVHESVAPQFREAFATAIKAQILSKPDMGPFVINTASADKNRALIADAVKQGARLEHGTAETTDEIPTRMLPTVISGVGTSMDIYQTESFGPSVSLFIFKTEAEALELANDTEYGLSAAVFTENLQTGLRMSRQIESGAVHINSMTIHDEHPLPHGGVKSSGFGRFNGYQGLDEFLYSKTITWMD
jgi:acyl-CoA reductase-like NAD-dependent aldehyde dehydrogenase